MPYRTVPVLRDAACSPGPAPLLGYTPPLPIPCRARLFPDDLLSPRPRERCIGGLALATRREHLGGALPLLRPRRRGAGARLGGRGEEMSLPLSPPGGDVSPSLSPPGGDLSPGVCPLDAGKFRSRSARDTRGWLGAALPGLAANHTLSPLAGCARAAGRGHASGAVLSAAAVAKRSPLPAGSPRPACERGRARRRRRPP